MRRTLISINKCHISYVDFEVLTVVVMKNSIFWDITLCSPVKVRVSLAACFTFISCLPYSSTFKTENKDSSETSVDFNRII
jgi:hypothetical protein